MGWIIAIIVFFIILKVFADRANRARNEQNGSDIRALCTELGVPFDSYNRIVLGEIDEVKHFATLLGQHGSPHMNSPWNVRMALAIADIHHKAEIVNSKAREIEDLIVGLQDFLYEYKESNGYLPEKVLIDIKTHEKFLNANIYNFQDNLFSDDIEFIPTVLNAGEKWKVFEVHSQVDKDIFEDVDEFDDESVSIDEYENDILNYYEKETPSHMLTLNSSYTDDLSETDMCSGSNNEISDEVNKELDEFLKDWIIEVADEEFEENTGNKDKNVICDHDKLELIDGIQFYLGEPFNGISLTYHINGQIKEKIPFSDGTIDGVFQSYYEDGNIKAEAPYVNGVLDGISREYYINGELKTEGQFSLGKAEGVMKEFFSNGLLKSKFMYNQNRINGLAKQYYEDGTLRCETPYVDGVVDGVAREFHETGLVKREVIFANGEPLSSKTF